MIRRPIAARRRWSKVGGATLLTVCGALGLAVPARAQERPGELVTLRGTVIDSSFRPLSSVLVYLSTAGIFTVTDDDGEFALADVEPGTDTLQFRGMGFAPRAFRLGLPDSVRGALDLGSILLAPGPPPTLTLAATVHDTIQNLPIVGAQVMVNDRVVGTTDTTGAFTRTGIPIDWGVNVILVRRVGYAPAFGTFWADEVTTQRTLVTAMDQQAVDLPAIVVEGDRVIFEYGRMRDFWRRRERGFGRFFTRAEIERRHPIYVSDMLRMVPGLMVIRQGTTTRIVSTRGAGRCAPSIWIDGFRQMEPDLMEPDLDAWVHPQDVEAIEVYVGIGETPGEFSGMNACGAIVVWTR